MKPESSGRVVVTGAGVLTSLGDSPGSVHAALCRNRSGLRPLEDYAETGMPPVAVGRLLEFEPTAYLGSGNLRPLDRTGRIGTATAKLALEDGGLDSEALDQRGVGLVLGTMFGSVHTISTFDRRAVVAGPKYAKPMQFANSVINAAAGQTAIWHDLWGINATVSGGITSGVQAIAYAADLIRSGQVEIVVAGGVDEFCFESLYGFYRAGLLCASTDGGSGCSIPFDSRRGGFCLGEAAALLTLETLESARDRGARILAEIRGAGSRFDRSRGKDRDQAVSAIARSLRQAMRAAAVAPDAIDCLSASANGSILADEHEAWGIREAFGDEASRLPVTAIKSMLGETLGASGAIQAVTLIEAMRGGSLPGIAGLESLADDFPLAGTAAECRQLEMRCGLVNSVGHDGKACSVVVELWDTDAAAAESGG